MTDPVEYCGLMWRPADHPHTFPELWLADGCRASVWKLGPGAIADGPWRWSAKDRSGRWHYGRAAGFHAAMQLAAEATRW